MLWLICRRSRTLLQLLTPIHPYLQHLRLQFQHLSYQHHFVVRLRLQSTLKNGKFNLHFVVVLFVSHFISDPVIFLVFCIILHLSTLILSDLWDLRQDSYYCSEYSPPCFYLLALIFSHFSSCLITVKSYAHSLELLPLISCTCSLVHPIGALDRQSNHPSLQLSYSAQQWCYLFGQLVLSVELCSVPSLIFNCEVLCLFVRLIYYHHPYSIFILVVLEVAFVVMEHHLLIFRSYC